MKRCTKCKETKPLGDFQKKSANRDGIDTICKPCKLDQKKRYNKKFFSDPANRRRYQDKKNLDRTQRHQKRKEEFYRKQRGRCAICCKRVTLEQSHLDHCHRTKQYRGLLCVNCNWGLGHFKDDPEILAAAANYVRRI